MEQSLIQGWSGAHGAIRAKQLCREEDFREQMKAVFSGEATDCLRIRSLGQMWEQIDDLAERIRQIEDRLAEQDKE